MSQPTKKPQPSGCLFILVSGIVLIGLLVVNMMFVKTFFAANFSNLDQRFFNAAQFLLPILLIFIELWIYDTTIDFFRYRKKD